MRASAALLMGSLHDSDTHSFLLQFHVCLLCFYLHKAQWEPLQLLVCRWWRRALASPLASGCLGQDLWFLRLEGRSVPELASPAVFILHRRDHLSLQSTRGLLWGRCLRELSKGSPLISEVSYIQLFIYSRNANMMDGYCCTKGECIFLNWLFLPFWYLYVIICYYMLQLCFSDDIITK